MRGETAHSGGADPAAALHLTGIEACLDGVIARQIKILRGGFCGYDKVLRGFLRHERRQQ